MEANHQPDDPIGRAIDLTMTRRRMLQLSAAAGVGAFIAACGGGLTSPSPLALQPTPAGGTPTGTPNATQSATTSLPPTASAVTGETPAATATAAASESVGPAPSLGGTLLFANWPAYIDLAGKAGIKQKYSPGSSPTINQFQEQTGVQVEYREKIGDNAAFYATIQPALVANAPTGWDLIVMTDWIAAKLIAKGWIEKIDQSQVPNCVANLRDPLRNLSWDPNNDYHYTWQTGMTGIGYDEDGLRSANIPPPTSLADLWAIATDHPKKVSFLTESRDTFGLTMLKLGLDPANVTIDSLQQAHDAIRPLVDNGIYFYDNSYLDYFASGNIWAAMVWSGDLAGSGTAKEHFVFPTEGCMVWSDNIMIPKGAQNPTAAMAMMNFVYDPKIAAQIENYVYYVTPVKGADEILKQLNASSPLSADLQNLLFPGPDIIAKQHSFQAPLDPEVEDTLNNLYLDLSGG